MAESIDLQQIPAQQFAITLGGNNYDLRIYMMDYSMAYDLDINDSRNTREDGSWLVSGFKFVHGVPMLPYRHQEINGNLILTVPDEDEADYTMFGITQFLAYLTQEETDNYRLAAGL